MCESYFFRYGTWDTFAELFSIIRTVYEVDERATFFLDDDRRVTERDTLVKLVFAPYKPRDLVINVQVALPRCTRPRAALTASRPDREPP